MAPPCRHGSRIAAGPFCAAAVAKHRAHCPDCAADMVFYLGFAEDSVDRCFETEDFSTLFASICPAKPGTGRSLGLAVCSIAIPAAVATPAAVAGLFRPFCL